METLPIIQYSLKKSASVFGIPVFDVDTLTAFDEEWPPPNHVCILASLPSFPTLSRAPPMFYKAS